MRIERTKNATRNIVSGVILKVYQIVMPFLLRTLMIYKLGVEYAGLNNLFASILQVLNLVELGVGSAMVFSMYKPIAEDDKDTICGLMRLYRIYYRVIGLVVLIIGGILIPALPKLIKTDTVPPNINITTLYLLNLVTVVISYWLFAYKNALLNAHQRNDISSKIMIATNTFQYLLQILAIIWLNSYYAYLIVMLVTQVLTNIVTAILVQKMYPEYAPVGRLNKKMISDINCRVRDLFTSKVGSVVTNSVNSIVISAFLGLSTLAIYQNYYFIVYSIISIVLVVFTACMAGIGNSLIVETKEKNLMDLKKFSFIISWISGFCSCCFLCLFQPFMKLWMGETMMLGFNAVIYFAAYYYVYEINQMLNIYKDAAGIWHEDRFRPLITAFVNLGLSIILVRRNEIYGVLIAAIIAMLGVGIPWLLHNLFTTVFDRKQIKSYVKQLLNYMIVTILGCVSCVFLCIKIEFASLWLTLFVRGIVCIIGFNAICFVCLRKNPEYAQAVQLIKKMLNVKRKSC